MVAKDSGAKAVSLSPLLCCTLHVSTEIGGQTFMELTRWVPAHFTKPQTSQLHGSDAAYQSTMVLADLGARLHGALNQLSRASVVDEQVRRHISSSWAP